ncbi:MAG: arginine deiminase-related protein [Cyclobacteriaceae bacterium]|nr:arginine deiminase-related protein [Cyclobacteriaceae bacterium]
MAEQITNNILMIRPIAFRMNEQTAVNNYYQKVLAGLDSNQIQANALKEFDYYADKLKSIGVNVTVINDTIEPSTPDSIFPNNWVSFHESGKVGLYPMFAENRRLERRQDILDSLVEQGFKIEEVIDITKYEQEGKNLEGTGSLILDRENKLAYAAISERTNRDVLKVFCEKFKYKAVVFHSNQTVNGDRLPIYHTNVMMCVADRFAIICADSIDDTTERTNTLQALISSGKEIIDITEDQVNRFAGNMLQVVGKGGQPYLIMSTAAYTSLTEEQISTIKSYSPIVHSSLDTIEALGGGSARCMMAEVFLPKN